MVGVHLEELLERVRAGALSTTEALAELRDLPFGDLGFARVDHHRAVRQGLFEVILGERKTADQIAGIAREQIRVGLGVLVTRLDAEKAAAVCAQVPELGYDPVARVATFEPTPREPLAIAPVVVATAGTSDLPVAEEALATLRVLGITSHRVVDVGVAGIHRLASERAAITAAPAIIVVAGMEGALASVIGGLVATPVVAVPTSVGYGVSLGGFTALFGMLTSCAAGVTVVNIDNGFGAAMAVHRIVVARGRGTP
ncbi:MAG TPA: nickel pincer cofactor biosynthesis protein LarB [Polyangiaceae bacterium]|nr:nickel pincer cofactor biosynthesis protein LarB [Polyangiaceae bacterium]